MSDTGYKTWSERLGIAPGEGLITLASGVYFLLIILVYYVLKPLREGLALEVGSDNVPLLNVLSMLSLIPANALYSLIVSHFRRDVFIPTLTRLCGLSLVVFWYIFRDTAVAEARLESLASPHALAIAGYYIWVNLFGLFMVSMFWSFMNDIFSLSQGRRLYTLIGYGGCIGGLGGGFLTSQLVHLLGAANLFLVVVVLLEPTIWLMRYIHRQSQILPNREHKTVEIAAVGSDSSPQETGWRRELNYSLAGVRLTFSSLFVGLMALEMFLYTFGSTLFSYQVNSLMENTIPTRSERTIYWAHLYNYINGLSLLTQFCLTQFTLRSSKPWNGLLLMPLSQVVGSIALLFNPVLGIAAATGVIRYAINYSTGRAVRELFFTPLTREEKYQAKGFIDTLIFRT
ncbi:MAG TPA: Npt1/Npt2 family nucleotide transporter, partial [Candidatus Ozemobacteraceae bacterium]|nr:Npt1/Npt2 family nucleotide transporter [Candidatus Ozemobacteraceae bacterium]